MDVFNPFSVTPAEESEIRQLARFIFNGANPTEQPELAEIYYKWKLYFEIFLQSVDRRTGSYIHLPFAGGLMEQPAKTMSALGVMQSEFFEKLAKDIKGAFNG